MSEPMTSQWNALVRGFFKDLFNLRGNGGGAGTIIGGGLFSTGEPGVMEETFKSTEPDEDGEEGGDDDDGAMGVVEVEDELGSRTS